MTQQHDAKQALFSALQANDGDTQHESVIAAIDRLAEINPTREPAHSKLLEGNWLLVNAPNFPGRQPNYGSRYIYRLGRLAFNVFEPAVLIEIERVTQPIFSTRNNNELTHDIVVRFKTIDRRIPELTGIVKNFAVCTPKNTTALVVEFTGGELIPSDRINTKQIEQWRSIFGNKSSKFSSKLRERIMSSIIKWKFGISKPSPMDDRGKMAFAIDKSPQGILEILYLDNELRITRGKSENVLISQRQISS